MFDLSKIFLRNGQASRAASSITDKELLSAYLEAYKSARQEIIDRIKQRDTVYSYYLVAVVAFAGLRAFGLALDAAPSSLVRYFEIPIAPLTVYPFLALVFCVIICQHQTQIGKLGYLCDVTLSRVRIKLITGEVFQNWETEHGRFNLGTLHHFRRAHFLLFNVPSFLACIAQSCLLFLSYLPRWHHLPQFTDWITLLQQWAGVLAVSGLNVLSWTLSILTALTLLRSERDRKELEDLRLKISSTPLDISQIENNFFSKSTPERDWVLCFWLAVLIAVFVVAQVVSYQFEDYLSPGSSKQDHSPVTYSANAGAGAMRHKKGAASPRLRKHLRQRAASSAQRSLPG